MTIYNPADLTLVRETRFLTLKEGLNRLQFSWENTRIDPTSLSLRPGYAAATQLDIQDLTFPPRIPHAGVWHVHSRRAGRVPVEISYLTSGLAWRAFYLGTLARDEKTLHLEGYVQITNASGEDYADARTRLIVGEVHLLDDIAALARRRYPYGRPQPEAGDVPPGASRQLKMHLQAAEAEGARGVSAAPTPPVLPGGRAEYFVYTIAGRQNLPHGWAKRLPGFRAEAVPVRNRYKYDEDRFGPQVYRFLNFGNDPAHRLGQSPIPEGDLKVFRRVDDDLHLAYEGASRINYVPVGEAAELNLGPASDVRVEPRLMRFATENYLFDGRGDISGWEEVHHFKVAVKNSRDLPVTIEIRRRIDAASWAIDLGEDGPGVAQVDLQTVQFTLDLPPASVREFGYTLTTRHGQNAEESLRPSEAMQSPANPAAEAGWTIRPRPPEDRQGPGRGSPAAPARR